MTWDQCQPWPHIIKAGAEKIRRSYDSCHSQGKGGSHNQEKQLGWLSTEVSWILTDLLHKSKSLAGSGMKLKNLGSAGMFKVGLQ